MDNLADWQVPTWVMVLVVGVLTISLIIGVPLARSAGSRRGRRLAHPELLTTKRQKATDTMLFLAALVPSVLVWLAVMGVSFLGLTGFAQRVMDWTHWTNMLVPLSLDGISVSFGAWAFVAVKRGRHPGRAYKIVLAAATMSAVLNFVHGHEEWSIWAGIYLAFLSFTGMAMFHELLEQFMAAYEDESALHSRYPRFGQRWLYAPFSTFAARRAWIVNPPRVPLRPSVRNALEHLEYVREERRLYRLGGATRVREEQQARLVELQARMEVKAAKRGDSTAPGAPPEPLPQPPALPQADGVLQADDVLQRLRKELSPQPVPPTNLAPPPRRPSPPADSPPTPAAGLATTPAEPAAANTPAEPAAPTTAAELAQVTPRRRRAENEPPSEAEQAVSPRRRRAAEDAEPSSEAEQAAPPRRQRVAEDAEPSSEAEQAVSPRRRRAAADAEPPSEAEQAVSPRRRRAADDAEPVAAPEPVETSPRRRRSTEVAEPSAVAESVVLPATEPVEAPSRRRRGVDVGESSAATDEPVETPSRRRAAKASAGTPEPSEAAVQPVEAPSRRRGTKAASEVAELSEAAVQPVQPTEPVPSAEPVQSVEAPSRRRGAKAGGNAAEPAEDAVEPTAASRKRSAKGGAAEVNGAEVTGAEVSGAPVDEAGARAAGETRQAEAAPEAGRDDGDHDRWRLEVPKSGWQRIGEAADAGLSAIPLFGASVSRPALPERVPQILDAHVRPGDDLNVGRLTNLVLRSLATPANRDSVADLVRAWVGQIERGTRGYLAGPRPTPEAARPVGQKLEYPFEILTLQKVVINRRPVACPDCGTEETLVFSGQHKRRPVEVSCGCGQRWPIVGLGSERVGEVLANELAIGQADLLHT